MFAIAIRYLNGFVAASEPDDRDRPEWPPHPGRCFMAMAAAHFQTGTDTAEREALLWLERLGQAPTIRAREALERAVVTHYVPVNDTAGPSKALLQALPLARDRQPRTFARAWLEHDTVYVAWRDVVAPESIRRGLIALCAKVTRIGHPSSLVQMWVAEPDEVGEPNWLPDEGRAVTTMRLAGPGTLEYLERCYDGEAVERFTGLQVAAHDDSDSDAQRRAKRALKAEFPVAAPTRLRPVLSIYQGYAIAAPATEQPAAPGTIFGPHPLVLALDREDGPYRDLDLACVLVLAQRWREAILSQSNDLPERVRQMLSGHDQDGAPLDGSHLAFLPFAFVGHPQADGRILGMGLALPESVTAGDRQEALRAVARVRRLLLGRLGTWRVTSRTETVPTLNLRSEVWTAHPHGATHWSSVTPVAYDRHAKTSDRASHHREVAAMIAQACTRIGLPAPREVIITPVSAHLGAPPAHAFPKLQRKDGSERRHTHVILVFERPVRGPVLIGAGRYRGYGFCRPMHEPAAAQP